jgi:hypothetical protein
VFTHINAEQRRRAADLAGARERWRIGEPYRAVELDVLVVRHPSQRPVPATAALISPRRRPWERSEKTASPLTYGSRRRTTIFPVELPLDWAAGAVSDAYVALGELSEQVRASLALAPRPDGWLRVNLPAGSSGDSTKVMSALAQLLEEASAPRYLISRQACVHASRTAPMRKVWYPVPADLARRRDRADAFHAAWMRWCGPSELVYLHNAPEATRELATTSWETSYRRIWT